MIVRQKLDSILSNYACVESAGFLNSAMINLSNKEDGRRIAEIFMSEMVKTYNGTCWGCNGPMLITRVLQDLCKTNITAEMVKQKTCAGFHVLKRKRCYPIYYQHWMQFFDESYTEIVMRKVENSLVVHLWNNLSKNTPLSTASTAAYTQLARQYCPKVISSCYDIF